MVRTFTRLAAVLVVAGLPVACATDGTTGVLRWEVGDGTGEEALFQTIQVLQLYQYDIERQAESPNLTVQTHWKDRMPFDDEVEAGAQAVRTRFLMLARERHQRAGGSSVYIVRLTAENQAQLEASSSEWQPFEPTPQFREYAADIAERLRTELRTGIRIH
jgi:hypothetical protein